jgi:hypothetical protein
MFTSWIHTCQTSTAFSNVFDVRKEADKVEYWDKMVRLLLPVRMPEIGSGWLIRSRLVSFRFALFRLIKLSTGLSM